MKKTSVLILVLTFMFLMSCGTENYNNITNNETINEEIENKNNVDNEVDEVVVESNNDEKNVMEEETEAVEDDTEEKVVLTDEELVFDEALLSKFNGKDGNAAYVAVDGIVYEVTDVKAWQSPHAGRFEPGKDYSEEIKQSPHGKKNLEGLKVVGRYEE